MNSIVIHRAFVRIACAAVLIAGCQTSTQDNFTNPPPGPPASCALTTAISGCGGGSLSYSCASDRPDDGDADLVCSDGTAVAGEDGGTAMLFCCAPYAQWATQCAPRSVAGCAAPAIGFFCAGGTSPGEADTSLVCAAPDGGSGGEYCCQSP